MEKSKTKSERTFRKDIRYEQSAMAVVFSANKILTIRESLFGKVALSLPKGHVEKGEQPLDAAIRECYEESGLKLTKENFIAELNSFSYDFSLQSGVRIKKKIFPFLFKTDDLAQLTAQTEEGIISATWMDVEEFLNNATYLSVKQVVLSALNKL